MTHMSLTLWSSVITTMTLGRTPVVPALARAPRRSAPATPMASASASGRPMRVARSSTLVARIRRPVAGAVGERRQARREAGPRRRQIGVPGHVEARLVAVPELVGVAAHVVELEGVGGPVAVGVVLGVGPARRPHLARRDAGAAQVLEQDLAPPRRRAAARQRQQR